MAAARGSAATGFSGRCVTVRSFASPRRVPLILQQEQAECGLACLAMVAGFHGNREGLRALRARLTPSVRGTALDELIAAAAGIGLAGRPVRLELPELPRLKLPALLHWRLDHFVVLVRLRRGKAVIHDPARGRIVVPRRELDRAFTGVALELSPTPGFTVAAERNPLSLPTLLASCRHLGRYLVLMALLLCVIQLLSLLPPVATQLLVDEVVLGQELPWLYRALGGLSAILLVAAMLEAMRRWIALYAGTLLATDATQAIVGHLYALPVRYFQSRHLGDVVSRLESLEPIRRAITETGINGVVQCAVVLGTLAIMLFYSPALALVSLAGMLAAGLLLAAVMPRTRRLSEEALVHQARQDSSLLETLRASAVVHALGLAPLRLAQWQNQFAFAMNARFLSGQLLIWQGFGSQLIAGAEQVLFLGVGIAGLMDGRLTLGTLFAFMTLRGRLAQATVTLLAIGRELYLLKVHLRRLSDIVLEDAPPPPPAGGIARDVRGSLHARKLSFRYPGGPLVLRDFCCVIGAGETVVITGPSGCGKTTLLRLLSMQLTADSGRLLVDGSELSLWHMPALRKQLALVLQEDSLFRGSLAENISAFDPEPDLGRIRDAAVAAAIWEDIERMPMMLNTPVGDMGSTLSGGQRQRLALARAFYRNPRMLFLDEATSHLDVETESRVLDHIDGLGITVVSVAHRPDVLRRAGRIIRLRT